MGKWTPIVEPEVWWTVQERLNEPKRITNRTGSTARKHLGSGLYLCGICETPVITSSNRYRCPAGHLNRSHSHVEPWVLKIIRARLARPDLADAIPTGDEPRLQAIRAQIGTHQARVKRAQHDYDQEIIEGYDLKRIRDRENTAIAALEAERRSLTATVDLGGVLDAKDPVTAFDNADLMIKRRVIDFFCTVRLYPHPRGRKTFDPETVRSRRRRSRPDDHTKEPMMAYPTLALHLLISAPGDVPTADMAVIRRTISQWNLNLGRVVGLTVLPVSWTEHAVPEFGERPQAILNDQIVEEADFAVALFYDRLGTQTGEADSGTAEEIRVLVDAGKSVAVLANSSPRSPLSGPALDERKRLDSYLNELRQTALVFEYAHDGDLVGHLNNFLSRATAQFQQSVEASKSAEPEGPDPSEGVWPRAEVRESVRTDSKGRVKTQRHWSLVLHNMSKGPATDVDFEFEDLSEDAYFGVHREDGPLGTIPPGGEARFPLLLAMGSPDAVECVVSWTDVAGNKRQTQATVRT